MNDPVETEKCANCKLEILSSNYTIHCLHCVKNIFLCDKCGQPVNYNKKIDHDQTNHVIVSCSNCNTQLEKYLLKDHLENDCPFRKVKCPICDIEVVATDISEHENYCGSRTEKCSECGEFVMLKYKTLHTDSNHSFIKLSDEPGPSPSWQNGKRTLHNFMPDLSSMTSKSFVDHKRKSSECNGRSRNLELNISCIDSPHDEAAKKNFDFMCNRKDKIQWSLESFPTIKDVKTSSRNSVDEWPALTSLRSLQISEEKENKLTRPEASSSSQTVDSDLMYAIQVSQELNSDVWFKDSNTKNEALKNSFKVLTENHLSGEKVIQKNMFDKNGSVEVNTSGNNLNYLYEEQEHVKLPCEFCGSLIISNELILHQSRCSLNVTEPFKRCNTRHKVPYFDESYDDSWEKKISCGVCNKVFKSSLLDSHELHCKRNPTRLGKNPNKGNYSRNVRSMNFKSEPGVENGAEANTTKLNRTATHSEWLSEFSKSSEGRKDFKNNLNCSETGGPNKTVKASRKSRRAPSPPRR